MARTLTIDQRHEVLHRVHLAPEETNVLRRYDVDLRLVATVDNAGTQCEYCQLVGQHVTCNTYLVTFDREYLCVDHCRECWSRVIDSDHDTDPEYHVITEMQQAT